MTPITCFAGRRVALFGLGGSGLATARALIAGGAQVEAYDDNAASRDRAGRGPGDERLVLRSRRPIGRASTASSSRRACR
mgnify:CR=1 FL=1